VIRRLRNWFLLGLLALLWPVLPAGAQLASSFYNVTGITTQKLPNAVRVTIATDGIVDYGFDQADFRQNGTGRTVFFKMRLTGARMRLPALVEIGTYPVDSATIAVGRDLLKWPNGVTDSPPSVPKVDITLRFYVPVRIARADTDEQTSPRMTTLRPLQVEIRRGDDRRSIVVTVITDRADLNAEARMRRSKPENQKRHLSVQAIPNAVGEAGSPRLHIDALHCTIADLFHEVNKQAPQITLDAAPDIESADVSAFLPSATPEELCAVLERTYALAASPFETNASSGIRLSRQSESDVEDIPLKYLAPAKARLMLPDCLLPLLRVDDEHHMLVASGPRILLDRMRRDLTLLDIPAPQVQVEAQVWEFSSTNDFNTALKAARTGNPDSETLDTEAGQLAVSITKDQQKSFNASLQAIQSAGRVKLVAHPSVVVVSGTNANMFVGQQRYVQVIRNDWDGAHAQAIQVPIGTSLGVQPSVGEGGIITMHVTPSVTTVDDIENGTGLPTIGSRTFDLNTRMGQGDMLIVAGLTEDDAGGSRRGVGPLGRLPLIGSLFSSRHRNSNKKQVLLLIRAHVT